MARWPHEEVRESGAVYPEGPLKVKITKQEDIEDNAGRFAINVQSRILEPKDLRGQPYSMRFIIGMTADTAAKFGIEEDLAAENSETWVKNPSANRYKGYLKAAGVASTGDTEEEAEDVVGKTIIIQNAVRDGKYNDAKAFYPADGDDAHAAPAAAPSKSGLVRKGAAAAKSAPKTVEAEAVEGGDDDWE